MKWSAALLVLLALATPACSDSVETAGSESCSALGAVADALDDVRAAEGDIDAAAAGFDTAQAVFETTVAPAELIPAWNQASEALRYYASSAAAAETPTRSELEVSSWRESFSEITQFGIDECGLGWRTPFDDCRRGSPPEGAAEVRILFPCAT